jgi:MtN3 and saliva related transmembrane protein
MNIDIEILISSIAAILTTSAFIPQAVKTIYTKNTKGISLYMYLFFTIGVIFWTIYAFMIISYPMIVANIITFALSMSILVIKINNIRKKNDQ